MAVAAEVRSVAARQMLKHGELADRIGMSRTTMSYKIRGINSWSVDDLVAVAKGLELDPQELLRSALAELAGVTS